MSELTRITLNLTARSVAALDRLCADGTNRTDAINRALRVAALVQDLAADNSLTVVCADGTRERIHML